MHVAFVWQYVLYFPNELCNKYIRGSPLGIETRYGLDGLEIGVKRRFPHTSRPVMGPSQTPVNSVTLLLISQLKIDNDNVLLDQFNNIYVNSCTFAKFLNSKPRFL
jgi:hypothetical protein